MKKISILVLILFLQISAFTQIDILIGTGVLGNTNSSYPCPLQDNYEGSRMQFLYRASELAAAGMNQGGIIGIRFNVVSLNSFVGVMEQMKISIGTTTATSLSANSWETGTTPIYGPIDYSVLAGDNSFVFSDTFFWNGSENIIVEVCNGDPTNNTDVFFTGNPTIPWTTGLAFNGSHTYRSDNIGSLCGIATTTNTGLQTNRPNITFVWKASIVPIKLVEFKGYSTQLGNKLEWITSSEVNNTGFEVQRSTNGNEFKKIGFVKSQTESANSTLNLQYGYYDIMPLLGTSYYRLQQIDKDGKYSVSKTIQVKVNKENSFILTAIYPVPATNKLNIVLNATSNEKVTIFIYDIAGRVVLQQQIRLLNGENLATVNIRELPLGNYTIKAVSNTSYETKVFKFLKQ